METDRHGETGLSEMSCLKISARLSRLEWSLASDCSVVNFVTGVFTRNASVRSWVLHVFTEQYVGEFFRVD